MTGKQPRAGRGFSVLTWLNLVCLDAPLVALSWQWLFARSFHISTARGANVALFLTAWLIYLADRFGDSLWRNPRGPLSLRQRFCLRQRPAWLLGIAGVALADGVVIATRLEYRAVRTGSIVGLLALVYLVVNQLWPRLWRALPLKEVSIGFLFAAGTMVGLAAGLTSAALPAWLLFAVLCSLNCISIAVWEREMDAAQERASIVSAFPSVGRFLPGVLILLAAVSFSLLRSGSVFGPVGWSALLLAAVHFWRERIQPDARTALADLVLLTPVALFLVVTIR